MNIVIKDVYDNFMNIMANKYGEWHKYHKETCEFLRRIKLSIQNGSNPEEAIKENDDNNLNIVDLQSL